MALDGKLASDAGESFSIGAFSSHIEREIAEAELLWPDSLDSSILAGMRACLGGREPSFHYLAEQANEAGQQLHRHLTIVEDSFSLGGFVALLEKEIIASSYKQFRSRHYRDAVFNAFVAVFDLIRSRTGLTDDGASLVAQAFSLSDPKLVIADLGTISGQSEQKGFIQMLQGVYLGIRNPKAHSLVNDLDEVTAAQYLVLASLLATRVREARLG
ncbi:MAG TPA: TIGR02391 family protein [Thermoanaerobaculia bacterium]|nr:TIGR02391 family protein [Thermoanaerobaculia bacterium]